MVLADDNFATIVAATAEGRAIFDNMRSFVRYLLASNVGEVLAVFACSLLSLPQPLSPVQLLWLNLVGDGAPALALALNPADPDILSRPPRPSSEGLVSPWALARIAVIGLYVGAATLAAPVLWYLSPGDMQVGGVGVAEEGMLDGQIGYHNGVLLASGRLLGSGHAAMTWEQLTGWHSCRESSAAVTSGGGVALLHAPPLIEGKGDGDGQEGQAAATAPTSPPSAPSSSVQTSSSALPVVAPQSQELPQPAPADPLLPPVVTLNPFTPLPPSPSPSPSCSVLLGGSRVPSSLSLSTLVLMEMLLALCSVAETSSILVTPPWANGWLVAATSASFAMHLAIMYVPALAQVFGMAPLSAGEWGVVAALSLPVVVVDEGRTWVTRMLTRTEKPTKP